MEQNSVILQVRQELDRLYAEQTNDSENNSIGEDDYVAGYLDALEHIEEFLNKLTLSQL